jgi:hypothetical protein
MTVETALTSEGTARSRDAFDLAVPLTVDLDGTLTRCDTLHHALLSLMRRSPWSCVPLACHVLRGRARFKAEVSSRFSVRPESLPYRQDVLGYLHDQRRGGRRIILATAADHRIARGVSEYLGIFDEVLATRDGRNLKGEAKRDVIRATAGDAFDYIGDSWADLPVFRAARYSLLVAPSRRLLARARASCHVHRVFE